MSTSIDTRCVFITPLMTLGALRAAIQASPRRAKVSEGDVDETAWRDFGEWVEQLRVRSGLSVGELAERAAVSRVWLQILRKGGRRIEGQWRPPNPKGDALARLARALDVPVEEMLARAGGTVPEGDRG